MPVLVLLLALVLAGASPPVRAADAVAPAFRFGLPHESLGASVGASLLSPDELRFVAALPELRVALQRVGAPPYEVVGANGEISGYQADLLAYVAGVLGLKLRPVVFDDWPSVLDAVRTGQADMVLTLGVTPDRMRYVDYTVGTVQVPTGVFARRGHSVPMSTARYALERGYYMNDLLARRYPQAGVVPVATTQQALQAVAQGRADYYLGSLLETVELLSREPVPGLEIRDLYSGGVGFYAFGLRKGLGPLAVVMSRVIAGQRGAGDAGLNSRAEAALPASAAVPRAVALNAGEAHVLARRPVWRVGAVQRLAMLNDVDGRNGHTGVAAEFTELVTQRLGVGVQVVSFENVGAMLDGLRSGAIDVVPFLTPTSARRREFVFSRPYLEMPYVLVGRSNAPMFWDLGSLAGRRLALAAQHPLRETLARAHPAIRLVDATDGNHAMDLVAEGRADAAVEIKVFANLRVNSDPQGRLRALGEVAELPAQFSFAVAAGAGSLMPLIDRALDQLSDAERERMLRRWVAVDLHPPALWRRHAPELALAATAVLLLTLSGWWWGRRWAREAEGRRAAVQVLDDVGRTMPGMTFRYTMGPRGGLRQTYYSSGTQTFLGLTPAPGQSVLDALAPRIDPADLAAAQAAQDDSLRTGQRFIVTCAYQHPAGRTLWLHAEAVRSVGEGGEITWTGYVVDVSSERELQSRMEAQGRERHLLLASASHELRAPTHTLSLALQSIDDAALPAVSSRALQIARDAAANLSELLNDVLDTARLQVGKLELRLQPVALRALVEQLRDAHQAGLAAKGIGLTVSVDARVPERALLDPVRTRQVLTNLLSNATKYTRAGQVHLAVTSEVAGAPADADAGADDAAPCGVFTVTDTGIGMSPEQQARLFEPFDTAASDQGSSGLGLSVARRLVLLMGGQISVESALGRGTTVCVRLPLRAVPDPAAPVARQGPPVDRVLLCDDDDVSRTLMAQALCNHGLQVEEVSDGQAALDRWRAGGVRLVITDLNMPGLDGMGLTRAIRAEEAAHPPRTVIIVCSGDAPPAGQAGVGYDAYFPKPAAARTLIDAIDSLA